MNNLELGIIGTIISRETITTGEKETLIDNTMKMAKLLNRDINNNNGFSPKFLFGVEKTLEQILGEKVEGAISELFIAPFNLDIFWDFLIYKNHDYEPELIGSNWVKRIMGK